jgi:hypothetical protein
MYPIKIRADHENGRELTLAEATRAAMNLDGQTTRIFVTAVYAEDTNGGLDFHKRPIVHPAGQAVFGLDAEIQSRRVRFGENVDAAVSISGIASHSPEIAMLRAQCYVTAAQIAAAANAAAAMTAAPAE